MGDRIGDGLRALPIYVVACRQVLVLCGHTYPQRLWCAWELCTLAAFRLQDDVAKRTVIIPLKSGDDGSDVLQGLRDLENFDVSNAHCYDPNEARRLSNVIAVVGRTRFNAIICTLAGRLISQNSRTFDQAMADL